MATSPKTNPKIIETDEGNTYFPTRNTKITDKASQTDDEDWVKQAFMISDSNMENKIDISNRYASTASLKFTSTALGGNIGINARPGFTPYADIRQSRLKSVKKTSISSISKTGMGRYYSEAIDDPGQTIFLRFGVPQFNGLLNYFSRAYDANMTTLAKTGRGLGFFFNLGNAIGTATLVATAAAVLGVAALATIGVAVLAFKIGSVAFGRPTSKFYTLKPTMHMYWSAVNILVNTLAINRGIMPKIPVIGQNENSQKIGNSPFKLDVEYLKEIRQLMPDLFTGITREDASYIDVFAIASKTQRLANTAFLEDYETANDAGDSNGSFKNYIQKRNETLHTDLSGTGPVKTLVEWVNKTLMLSSYFGSNSVGQSNTGNTDSKPPSPVSSDIDPRIDPRDGKEVSKGDSGLTNISDFLDAEFRQGSQFAVFKVDSTGSVSESFSNVTTEAEISQKINGSASQIRDIRFSLADGNLAKNALTDVIGSVAGAATDVLIGAADGFTGGLSNIIVGLASAGFIDIPKHWNNSNARLPTGSYKMKLISPYGNVMSQFQNIYIPLCMLLAGTLPLSMGRASYGSPMLCQVYDRGRCQIKLGMIESLSVTRGTSNLPFNTKGNALAIDVSFTVVDLSTIMHMPLTASGMFGNTVEMTLDEDNILMDYLAVLAGQDLYSQFFAYPKAKMRIAKSMLSINRMFSAAEWGSAVHETLTTGALGFTMVGNVIENLVGNSATLAGSTNAGG
jgi:hypothetical protein